MRLVFIVFVFCIVHTHRPVHKEPQVVEIKYKTWSEDSMKAALQAVAVG